MASTTTTHDHFMSSTIRLRPRPRPSRPKRPKYRAARAFYIFLFLGTCFATYSLLTHAYHEYYSPPRTLHTRALEQPIHKLGGGDEECRLVHKARDQCAYIRAHCPADEGGFTAYLELYFCRLKDAKPVAFLILISWLGLLFSTIGIAASDFFCIDLSTIAGILGMSESVAGVTFLAFGNGSPDVFSTFAAMSTDSGSLAVGELFGAAGFITAVVAGSMALIRPFHVARKSFVRDVGFFIVAAAFSMLFLWDGRLHFWECAAMVLYYIIYVAFVVGWHWWLGRRKRRRAKEVAARGHFVPDDDELDPEQEEYHDDPDEAPERPSFSRGTSREDWAALEGGSPYDEGNEDDEEEARDRWMSELASNMRLTRNTRARSNTVTPVRPSLVGALEFQAVLKSLQKSRNIKTIPMNSRRYSDDPAYTTAQQQDLLSSPSDPASRPPYEILITDEEVTSPIVQTHIQQPNLAAPQSAPPSRTRAVSANDAAALRINTNLQKLSPVTSEDNLVDLSTSKHKKSDSLAVPSVESLQVPRSPLLTVEPATPRREVPTQRRRAKTDARPGSMLLTPDDARGRPGTGDYFYPHAPSRRGTDSPVDDPSQPARVPSARNLPKIMIPGKARSPGSSRSTSPFPAYRDFPSPSVTGSDRSPISTRPPSIYLPGPQLSSLASPESIAADDSAEQERPRRPDWLARIWPYRILPPPGVMISTLFPTIYHWHEKTWWEKCLGIVAAPSVFCLTITLPVVESEKELNDSVSEHPHKDFSWDSARSKSIPALLTPATPGSGGIKGVTPEWMDDPDTPHPHSMETAGVTGMGNSASIAVGAEEHYRTNDGMHVPRLTSEPQAMDQSHLDEVQEAPPEPWNRWLTLIQLFTAPIFIVLSIYLQAPDGLPMSWLVRAIFICLPISIGLLVLMLLTTTPTRRPEPYRIILSLAGFVVAIAWISAIASQVVGALKALAVILNMSHAIMGLTIFAVGNSLGDLVADVTVAKLGYPVMALSACFGGPMLNILLGVGLSGSYILIKGAERRHEKHPTKGIKFHSYHMDVSKTLIVSGITLLITLLGLLIAVPMNNWVLSRKIGWALIALWTLSTIFNVVIEVTGILGDAESLFHIGQKCMGIAC